MSEPDLRGLGSKFFPSPVSAIIGEDTERLSEIESSRDPASPPVHENSVASHATP